MNQISLEESQQANDLCFGNFAVKRSKMSWQKAFPKKAEFVYLLEHYYAEQSWMELIVRDQTRLVFMFARKTVVDSFCDFFQYYQLSADIFHLL